jgi:hypothetical protein
MAGKSRNAPDEQRTRIAQLYTVVRVINRRNCDSSADASLERSNRGWKNSSPPLIEAARPKNEVQCCTYNNSEYSVIVPMVAMSMGFDIPRNMLTPMPSSAHCCPISSQVSMRGRYSCVSLSVSYRDVSSVLGCNAPGPLVAVDAAKTTTCPPRPSLKK